ncbi:hypothetical protein ACWDUN_14790 [Mycobacterium sp. NPDC003323]
MTTYTRFGIGLAATALSITFLTGCSKVAEIQQLTDAASTAVEQLNETADGLVDIAAGDMLTTESIDAAITAISEKVGADPMQVVELVFTDMSVTAQAIDPAAPTELNQWTYTAGTVGPMRPVDYGDDAEALRQNLFSVTEVPTTAIVAAIDKAAAASGIADAAVQSVVIKRNLPFGDELQILLNVQGERSSKQVRADVTGQITEVV